MIQSDLFFPDRWRSLNLWRGHVFTIPKRSVRWLFYWRALFKGVSTAPWFDIHQGLPMKRPSCTKHFLAAYMVQIDAIVTTLDHLSSSAFHCFFGGQEKWMRTPQKDTTLEISIGFLQRNAFKYWTGNIHNPLFKTPSSHHRTWSPQEDLRGMTVKIPWFYQMVGDPKMVTVREIPPKMPETFRFRHNINYSSFITRWFKVAFLSPGWRSLYLWKGHVNSPSQKGHVRRITWQMVV